MSSVHPLLLKLIEKGVRIPAPESVEIGDDIDPGRISGDNVTLHAGTRLFGSNTLICKDVVIGAEGPVTIDNCRIGPEVRLKGGYFQKAVFLKGASAGLGSHVREGTILEEKAGIAHTVGLKQTILFPYVTLGSLINFCDCLMAGGTGPRNHSEVGSSYIHFNFTPNQDKATPSLIGDVPHGVMLDQPPIFLGGQGGLVGPCRIAFGTVIAAGTIHRKDVMEPGLLVFGGGGGKGGRVPYRPGNYSGIKRIVTHNINYLANLAALLQWALHVRRLCVSQDYPEPLHEGLVNNIKVALSERVKRLGEFSEKSGNTELKDRMPTIQRRFSSADDIKGDEKTRDRFLETIEKSIEERGPDYLTVIQSLAPTAKAEGTQWLSGIVEVTSTELIG